MQQINAYIKLVQFNDKNFHNPLNWHFKCKIDAPTILKLVVLYILIMNTIIKAVRRVDIVSSSESNVSKQ